MQIKRRGPVTIVPMECIPEKCPNTGYGRQPRWGDAMLVADYIAIGILIVLTLWGGKHLLTRNKS
jgi:hypothetical protein